MTTSDTSTASDGQRVLWLPVPGFALRVRVVLDASSDLDALSTTILELLRLRERSTTDLHDLLGIEQDLIRSALMDLYDRGFVAATEEDEDRFVLQREDYQSLQGA